MLIAPVPLLEVLLWIVEFVILTIAVVLEVTLKSIPALEEVAVVFLIVVLIRFNSPVPDAVT